MPTEPRPRSAGTADEAAALRFAEAAGSDASAHDRSQATSGSAHDGFAAARVAVAKTDASAHDASQVTSGSAHDGDAARDALAETDASVHDDLAAAREQRIRRMLDFEARWTSHGGAKARAIRAEFGWSTTRYYQVLDGLLETREAVRHDPMLVRRLLRLREAR